MGFTGQYCGDEANTGSRRIPEGLWWLGGLQGALVLCGMGKPGGCAEKQKHWPERSQGPARLDQSHYGVGCHRTDLGAAMGKEFSTTVAMRQEPPGWQHQGRAEPLVLVLHYRLPFLEEQRKAVGPCSGPGLC